MGLAGTIVNLLSLAGLVRLGLPNLGAALLATEIAIIHNFLWNDKWTFKQNQASTNGSNSRLARFGRFQLVTTLTGILSLGLFAGLNSGLGWHYLLAQLGAIGVATVLNFGANSKLTWNRNHVRSVPGWLKTGTGEMQDY